MRLLMTLLKYKQCPFINVVDETSCVISALDLGVLKLPAGGMQLVLQLLKTISFDSDKTK